MINQFDAPSGDRDKVIKMLNGGLLVSDHVEIFGHIQRTEDFGQNRLWDTYPNLENKM